MRRRRFRRIRRFGRRFRRRFRGMRVSRNRFRRRLGYRS